MIKFEKSAGLLKYIEENKESLIDSITAAAYANTTHFSQLSQVHDYKNNTREAVCKNCGLNREQVRYGENYERLFNQKASSPKCSKAKNPFIITDIIRIEELRYDSWYNKGKEVLDRELLKGINGENLASIHETFGYSPDDITDIFELQIDETIKLEYEEAFQKRREMGKAGNKKVILKAKTLD